MSDPDSSLAYDQPEHSQDHLLEESAHWDSSHYGAPSNSHPNWAPVQHAPQADYYATNHHLSNPGQ